MSSISEYFDELFLRCLTLLKTDPDFNGFAIEYVALDDYISIAW